MADAKQDMNSGPSQSRVVLAKPRLGGFGSSNFGIAETSKTASSGLSSVLRPPQLKPTQTSNPFSKNLPGNELDEQSVDKPKATDENTEKIEDRLKDTSKENVEAPKFVPLGTSTVTSRTNSNVPTSNQATASSSGFVFGQNLSERVVFKENVNNGDASSVDHSATNGTSELLFTNAVASVKDNNQDESGPSEAGSKEGLAAAAAEYERSHARPPPPPSNFTTTGEEDEINVLQISCRLFAWEAGSWRERGRGVLRLNDAAGGAGEASRVVARVSGSLRVVLNTKLWPAMFVERAGNKSLRITAADAQQQVKLFLIMGAPSDISQLHRGLLSRIAVAKRLTNTRSNSSVSSEASNRLEPQYRNESGGKVEHPHTLDGDDNFDDVTPQADDDLGESPNADGGESLDATAGSPERLEANDDGIQSESIDQPDTQSDHSNALKRKDPQPDEQTSTKRQCPDIVIQ